MVGFEGDLVFVEKGKEEDFDDFIKLLLISEPFMYQELFGRYYVKVIKDLFSRGGDFLSYENVIFAKSEGKVLGMLLGYSYWDFRKMFFSSVLVLLGAVGFGFFISLPKFFKLRGVMIEIGDGDFYVSNLAVYPEYRGSGIGRRLMEEAEKIAISMGCTRICLDVSWDNEKAMGFYKKLGFYEVGVGRKVEIGGKAFQLVRFVKNL